MNDSQLLKQYVHQKSEAAFAKLIERHMKLVYWTCKRSLGDVQLAEDASQAVFLLLAQKAAKLQKIDSLAGWLFNAARLISCNAARAERRRQHHEGEAAREMIHHSTSKPDVHDIDHWLSEAIGTLSVNEREVILLRYFEELSFAEIATRTGSLENTASKRAFYAIERMRRFLTKKGIALSVAGLTALLIERSIESPSDSCEAATIYAVQVLTASTTTRVAQVSHIDLMTKGVYFTMQGAKYKYLIAGAVLLLIGIIVIPVMLHRHAGASAPLSQIPVTAIDSAPGDPSTLARKEIEPAILAEQTEWVQGSWKAEPWDSPTRVIVEGDRSRHTPTDAYYDFWNKTNNTVGNMRPNHLQTVQVKSFQLNGDTATVQIMVKSENGPPAPEQSVWQKIDGKWIDIGPDSIPFMSSRPH